MILIVFLCGMLRLFGRFGPNVYRDKSLEPHDSHLASGLSMRPEPIPVRPTRFFPPLLEQYYSGKRQATIDCKDTYGGQHCQAQQRRGVHGQRRYVALAFMIEHPQNCSNDRDNRDMFRVIAAEPLKMERFSRLHSLISALQGGRIPDRPRICRTHKQSYILLCGTT